MSYTKESFQQHIINEHHQSKIAEYLREIVYGGSDGIITTFAVVAGFSGAQRGGVVESSILIVLLFGFANLFADAASMGLGNVLSILADKDVYKTHRDKELQEIKKNPLQEKEETLYILKSKGYSQKDAQQMTDLYAKNKEYWADFMMQYEFEISNPETENPLFTGLATFLSFIVFGAIPLLPYIVASDYEDIFSISILASIGALVLLGIIRWKVTTQSLFRSIVEIVLLGGLSAIIAYTVGTFFSI